jgi:hypothetical protein
MFYYKVEHWDEIDHETRQESGILAAKDYAHAAGRVAEYYGAENMISMYLEEWEDVLTEDEILEGFEKADVRE